MYNGNPVLGVVNAADFGLNPNATPEENSSYAQEALDYCFDNNYTCFIPKGEYKISLPIIIRGRSGQTSTSGNTVVKGQGRELVNFVKVGEAVHTDLPARMQVNAAVIIADSEKTGLLSSQARNLDISGFSASGISEELSCEYGFYMPTSIVESKFSDLMSQYTKKSFWTDGGDIYLCSFNRFRLVRCDYGFYTNGGVNTSINLSDCYVVRSKVCGIKLQATYSQINNPAIDSAKGVCYDLDNFRGTVISPGCESKDADIVFNFKGGTPAKGNAVIIGAHTNAITGNSEGIHIKMGVNSVVFMGGHINTHDSSQSETIGRLVEFGGAVSVPSTLKFISTRTNPFTELPRMSRSGIKLTWEDWEMNTPISHTNIKSLLSIDSNSGSDGHLKIINNQLYSDNGSEVVLRPAQLFKNGNVLFL